MYIQAFSKPSQPKHTLNKELLDTTNQSLITKCQMGPWHSLTFLHIHVWTVGQRDKMCTYENNAVEFELLIITRGHETEESVFAKAVALAKTDLLPPRAHAFPPFSLRRNVLPGWRPLRCLIQSLIQSRFTFGQGNFFGYMYIICVYSCLGCLTFVDVFFSLYVTRQLL